MKKITLFSLLLPLLIYAMACNNGAKNREKKPQVDVTKVAEQQPEVHGKEIKAIELTNPLDKAMIAEGKGIFDLKCSACHKLSAEKVVGPGWKGVTTRREPVWIMNMITNVDIMLEKDAEAQKLLEQCLVRMPNQNISDKEARSILEFMRENDAKK